MERQNAKSKKKKYRINQAMTEKNQNDATTRAQLLTKRLPLSESPIQKMRL